MKPGFIDYVMGSVVILYVAMMVFLIVLFATETTADTDHCIRNETGRYCLVEE